MTQRSKKIYIAVVVITVLLSAAVLMFGRSGTPTAPLNLTVQPTLLSPKGPTDLVVFPADNQFDLSVFESTTFKTLKVYTPLSVTEGELGRDDPFKPY